MSALAIAIFAHFYGLLFNSRKVDGDHRHALEMKTANRSIETFEET